MRHYHSFEELKRSLYLWILPFIIIALLLYNLVDKTGYYPYYILVTRMLIPWFILCWVFLYFHRFIRWIEYANLILISILHLAVMFDSIYNYMAQDKPGAVGMTIIWTPMIFIYIFISLRARQALYFSIGVFMITLLMGILNITHIHSDYWESLCEFYIANIVYIVILFFTRYLYKLYAELESVKRNAYKDFLTHVANRHQIDIWLEKHIEMANTKKQPFSIIFFDIDYFKVINDQFGHKTGDLVLIELAQLIKNSLPKGEHFGRWGGEEFIIITERAKEQAKELAEYLRETISQHEFEIAGKQTLSFGVTEYQPNDTVDTILSRVDTGLYNSKNIGRDKVTLI